MKPETGNSKLRAAKMVMIAVTALTFLGANSRFSKLGHQLMCTCGCNQILLKCNHVGCAYSERMRNELTTGLASGDSDSLVLQRFVQKYGNTVRGAPTSVGFNVVLWITAFVMLVLALMNAAWLVRVWRVRAVELPVARPNLGCRMAELVQKSPLFSETPQKTVVKLPSAHRNATTDADR